MSMSAEADDLTVGIYISATAKGELSIECNWCSIGDYVFYRGEDIRVTGSNWLSQAVQHIAAHHEKKGIVTT